jgi:tetratricopeptide (TPR) repeat protein
MHDILTTAIERHRTGQLGEAARLYQRVLAGDQENADALHLLGVLRHQQGDHARAIELIGRAVAVRPNAAIFHANLAEAYRALGDFERAAGCCRTALQLWPDYPEALCNLGAALQGLGRNGEAAEPLRRALELRPEFGVAHNNLGIVLRELGQPEEALDHFRRAVELEPAFAPARTNLGQLLLSRGQAEEALPHCQEAVRLDPNVAVLHHNLGNVFRALDRLIDARAAYLEALRLNPNLALASAHLGLVLEREGQFDESLPWLKKAVDLDPGNADFWEWVGDVYDDMEEPGQAIVCWQHVLDIEPERARAHLALGWCLQEEGRSAEAREHYLTAARLEPESGQPPLELGGLHEELGAMGDAEASFREALRLQPAYALPLARLGTLLRGKLPETDVAAIEHRLIDHQLGPGPRARLLFALSHVFDARGEFVRAAECTREANALALSLARGRRAYKPEEHERFVNGLVRAFDQDLFALLAGTGVATRRPIFIVGLPRSGTTLIEQVLASHSRVHGAGELRVARETFEAIPALLGRPGPTRDCIPFLDAPAVRTLAEQHLDRLAALDDKSGAERTVDKMPDNYLYLGLLAILFPNALFIHCRRDLRDVALSCWMTDFRSIRWANDPGHIASRFQQYGRLMNHWRAVLPVPIHEVEYEETVDDLEGVARRLVAAAGLEWEPACLEFHRTERPIRTASVAQVREPVYRRSLGRWKNYEPALSEMFAAVAAHGEAVSQPYGDQGS